MAKHQPKKLPCDVNSRATAIGKIATGETVLPEESAKTTSGRKGGKKGGGAPGPLAGALARQCLASDG